MGVGWIGGSIAPFVGAASVAAASWGLAESFTRKRRMAFPSILFFLTFVIGVYYAVIGAFGPMFRFQPVSGQSYATALSNYAWHSALASFVVIGAAWAHWKRFAVPIAFATIVGAIAYSLYGVINAALIPSITQPSSLQGFVHTYQLMMWLVLIIGLAVFAYAMHWDMQDRARQSQKADVAFWLHLVASPLVVHPVFVLVGMNMLSVFSPIDSNFAQLSPSGTFIAITAIVIYALLAVVALVVDRRDSCFGAGLRLGSRNLFGTTGWLFGNRVCRRYHRYRIELVDAVCLLAKDATFCDATGSAKPARTSAVDCLTRHQFHQAPFNRGEHRPKVAPALHHRTTLTHQRPFALAVAQARPFFDTKFGAFGGATERAEHGGIAA